MNAPAIARCLVEEMLAAGITDAVVCPGSRSAPILLSLADAERRGLMRLHVRVDERSAAYLALGLTRVSGRPVPVVTTSGTAAVNLHPAVVEAAYGGLPLVAVTADRPAAMRGSGANQTIDQRALFGVDAVALDWAQGDPQGLRDALDAAMRLSFPLHINVPLAEPLVAQGQHSVTVPTVRDAVGDRSEPRRLLRDLLPADIDPSRGLIVAGDGIDAAAARHLGELATTSGWPIISEPSGNLSQDDLSLLHGPLLLASDDFMADHGPDVVVTVGRVGLHRSVSRLLLSAPVHLAVDVAPWLGRVDPQRTASAMLTAVPTADGSAVIADPMWAAEWRAADDRVAAALERVFSDAPLSGPVVAREVVRAAGRGDLLVVGASWPVRHVSEFAGGVPAHCIGNRGTSGIDGVISTAWGAAIAQGDAHPDATTYALLGDLTAIYDRNGLLAAPGEARPRLAYVVIDNDGGGIFSSLEQGAPEFAADFERVFGTPHGADIAALLSAPSIAVETVTTVDDLRASLRAEGGGVRIIVARGTDRAAEHEFETRLRSAALSAAGSG